MYAMIYFCPSDSRNWLQKAQIEDRPWYIHYVYSFYWANTTMVTVGYGDLSPNNFVEAIVVTMIQVVGTAIFGYMINVIGITVNEIQKKNLEFEEHQATILKMKDHYNLTRELCYKMKNDIKKKESQSKETPLKNNEETEFLEYIDSSLKEEFVLETNM